MAEIVSHTQKCTICGEEKEIHEFNKEKRKKSGFRSDCKKCCSKRKKIYYKNNIEKSLEDMRQYYLRNKETALKRAKAWYESNKDKRIVSSRKWREKNKDKYLESCRKATKKWMKNNPEYRNKWRKENPLKSRQYDHNRRAILRNDKNKISADEWMAVLDFYEHKCLRCGKSDKEVDLHIDHVIPVSKSGKNVIENIQPLCKSCNSKKYTRVTDYRKSFYRA